MDPLILSESWGPIWIAGAIVVFLGWFLYLGWLGVPLKNSWGGWGSPFLIAIHWPIILGLVIIFGPIWFLFRAMEKT